MKSKRPVALCVVGARPNFMKIAPVMAALKDSGALDAKLVHTGQHYDPEMNDAFFTELGIPPPDVNLEVGSASHAVQTAEVMRRIEPVIDRMAPAVVVVVGDVNSTLAATLVAVKKGIKMAHVEAGLRSFDRTMPEEINRVLTDQVSDFLFTTERSALANLAREGVPGDRVFFVGNVMIDSLRRSLSRAVAPERTLAAAGFNRPSSFAVLTLHRPANVDDPAALKQILETLADLGRETPIVFPVHPRTRARVTAAGLDSLLAPPSILVLPPQGYAAMLGLMRDARLVLTDSGGIQEETTALGVPCLTLRDTTERPITVSEGTNEIVGRDPGRIRSAYAEIIRTGGKAGRSPELWDGAAAPRIAAVLADKLAQPR
ncbi:MAG TPA: UDP-N-acetylglucosamine 2-epimerase (non-hydrolyzing) [Alphaproteobacteria bacterium]